MPVGHIPLTISTKFIGGKVGGRSDVYSKSKISTDWTLLSAIKKEKFSLEEGAKVLDWAGFNSLPQDLQSETLMITDCATQPGILL